MSATLDDIRNELIGIEATLGQLMTNRPINPDQVQLVQGLSDIDPNLGIMVAGEFRTGNGKIPGSGFSGVRMVYPAVLYGSEYWNIAGVNADVLQFGLRSSDGVALAGAGAVYLDATGITINGSKININSSLGTNVVGTIGGETGATLTAYNTILIYATHATQGRGVELDAITGVNSASLLLESDASPKAVIYIDTTPIITVTSSTITLAVGVTFSGNITMASTKWIGIGAAAGRFTFTDAATDTIALNAADLLIDTGRYVGIGAAAGRIVFTDAAVDVITISAASVVIDQYLEVAGGNAGINLLLSRGSATQVGLNLSQSGTGNALLYIPASTNKLIFQGGGNNNLSIDMTNRRVGILNDSPAVTLDVNGIINAQTQLNVVSVKVVGARITGWAAATNTKSKATFDTITVTTANLAARVGQLIDDLMTHGLIGT